ncbi:MAG: preprotein translocase subunit SecA [Myxococcales bacterium]|nr:MAG: preprotein translocase subunit SecA [Myxococcales bacterium]
MWREVIDWLTEPSAKAVLGRVNARREETRALSDAALRAKTGEFKARLEKGERLFSLMPEAFAAVREAARRTIGLEPFDVQILGGVQLAKGRIVEMKTGEGKTLVATLPACLHALAGQGVHVVTVNDYLARRDADWMGAVYAFLGLSVGCIQERMGDSPYEEGRARKAAYACDVTYGTNSELVFDLLRDNLAYSLDDVVHRGQHYAIVDEVDLLLIDEAQTPLIISGKGEEDKGIFKTVDRITRTLKEGPDYQADRKTRTAALTDEGLTRVERSLGVGSLSHPDNLPWMHAVHQSLQAHAVFGRDVEYIVEDGRVFIVDEHTGRVSEDKRFSDGLHQALEAKEGVPIQTEDVTLAKTSYQHYFLGYRTLAGMTGTAWSEREEFAKIYGRKVVRLPTHRPMVRKDYERIVFKTLEAKHNAVVEEVVEAHEAGRPVLVGSVSVAESERLSALLSRRGVPHHVLNAKQHAREAEIVVLAGARGAVTISTNMAGRGTDIMLGGNPEALAARETAPSSPAHAEALARAKRQCAEEHDAIAEAGGLYVIGTGEHESVRIDNQLRGRSGRQGDPGSSIYFVSLDDPVYQKFGRERTLPELRRLLENHPDDEPVENPRVGSALKELRKKVEIENYAIRVDVFKFDTVVAERRTSIWNWRRSLLEQGDLDAWRGEAEELAADALDAVYDELRRAPRDEADAGPPPTQDALWRLALAQLFGRALDEGTTIFDADRAHTLLVERYRARFGLGMDEPIAGWERRTLLDTIDHLWTQFLTDLERVETGIGLRGYASLDPFIEFRKEAGQLFGQFMRDVRLHAARAWLAVDPAQIREAQARRREASLAPTRDGSSGRPVRPRRERAVDRLPTLKGARRKQRRG